MIVEKVGDDLGHRARNAALKIQGWSFQFPGCMFLVGQQYILVGRLFDSQTGKIFLRICLAKSRSRSMSTD